jgi:hypothetical protein
VAGGRWQRAGGDARSLVDGRALASQHAPARATAGGPSTRCGMAHGMARGMAHGMHGHAACAARRGCQCLCAPPAAVRAEAVLMGSCWGFPLRY